MPRKLKHCLEQGGNTTLMVWADLDHDMADGDALRRAFWNAAQRQGITVEQFNQVVFVFAKDRLENWIEFLNTETTDESREGPRVRNDRDAARAARRLVAHCSHSVSIPNLPPSLEWSCRNWRALVERMR